MFSNERRMIHCKSQMGSGSFGDRRHRDDRNGRWTGWVGGGSSRASSSVSSWSSAKLAGQPNAGAASPTSCFPPPSPPPGSDALPDTRGEEGFPLTRLIPSHPNQQTTVQATSLSGLPATTAVAAMPEKLVSGTWLSRQHTADPRLS